MVCWASTFEPITNPKSVFNSVALLPSIPSAVNFAKSSSAAPPVWSTLSELVSSIPKVKTSVAAAVPNPNVVLAVAASASSINVLPNIETLAAGNAASAVTPCAAVA